MIRFDNTPTTTLAVCQCGWRHQALSLERAELAARSHLETCLPFIGDPETRARALDADLKRRRRRDTP